MDLLSMAQSVPQALDDSTVSVLAMLIGVVGGWMITSLHQQAKAKKVKTSRRQNPTLRKPD
jgi:hypothetical protein